MQEEQNPILCGVTWARTWIPIDAKHSNVIKMRYVQNSIGRQLNKCFSMLREAFRQAQLGPLELPPLRK
jgi:hypothetical protein